MAWRLQCLIWITALAVSAENYEPYIMNRGYKQSGFSDSKARIINPVSSRFDEAHHNVTNRLQVKRGTSEASWRDKVVFPGPTMAYSFDPEITQECEELGYCRNVPNYPKDHVRSILNEFGNIADWFQMDTFDIDVQIAQRLGGFTNDQTFELCNFTTEIVYPFSAPDKNNEWFQIINDEKNPVQGFLAEKCVDQGPQKAPCSQIAMIQPGYNASCVQKHVFRKVAAISKTDGKPIQKQLKLPSCCSCVAYSI